MNLKKTKKIPITASSKNIPKIKGYLLLIENPSEKEYHLLASWRRKNRRWFRDTKPVTVSSTKKWWQEVQGNPLRVLFWVEDLDGHILGHMGLNRFKGASCELDNVIRGKKISPGLMSLAVSSLITWALRSLPIKRIYLQTNYDNIHAINFYENCRFKIIKHSKPLLKMRYFPK